MKLRLGELVPIKKGFHQAQGANVRPAVVLLDTGDDDILAVPVTSRIRFSEFDLAIGDWTAASLKVPSYVRCFQSSTSFGHLGR